MLKKKLVLKANIRFNIEESNTILDLKRNVKAVAIAHIHKITITNKVISFGKGKFIYSYLLRNKKFLLIIVTEIDVNKVK